MPRKIVLQLENGETPVLTESGPVDELQLQDVINKHPEVIPVEEFGMQGPMMVVGQETTLPSGAVDLVGLTREGELIVVEFKTGPQNPDFRHALAQLIDYGADLWQMTFEEFESAVATRYFGSERCQDTLLRGKNSLREAAMAFWVDFSTEEMTALRERLADRLRKGEFEYVLIAQSFKAPILKSVEYLNATTQGARFYAVELVKFSADGIAAFETRTVAKPDRRTPSSGYTSEREALKKVDDNYRTTLESLFEACRGLGLRFEWQSIGTSIRIMTSSGAPLSIAWWFPPGAKGWMGLTDFTIGYDPSSAGRFPDLLHTMDDYISKVKDIKGGQFVDRQYVRGYSFTPELVKGNVKVFIDIMAGLTQSSEF